MLIGNDAHAAPNEKQEKTPAKVDYSFLVRLCGIWNDLTIVLTFAFCAWAGLYTDVAPRWQFAEDDEGLQQMAWLYLLAAVMTLTAFVFELISVLVENSPAEQKQEGDPASVNSEDSKVMMLVYAALSCSYFKMGVKCREWVHTDPLAFGGPRPVFTMRYLEWSICMPLLLALSGDAVSDGGRRQSEVNIELAHAETDIKEDNRSRFVQQAHMVAEIPIVAARRLAKMGIGPSARCTVVYIWSSWQALVVEDEFTRWVLLNVSFSAYAVAALEQSLHSYLLFNRARQTDLGYLLAFQVFLAFFYGLIYLGAVFNFYSWWTEQVAYTFSDVGAKLLHSSFLMSLRRQRNLHELSALRRAALIIASDLRRMIRQANVPIFVVNADLEVQDWNLKIAEVTGIPRHDALNKTLTGLLSSNELSPWWTAAGALINDAMEERDPEAVQMHIDAPSIRGSRHSVMAMSAFCLRSGNGSIKGAVCIGQDITALTEEKQRAEALAEGLGRLINSANAPIFQVDLSDEIVVWNSWLAKVTGWASDQVLGKHISIVLSPWCKKKYQDACKKAYNSGDADRFEINVVKRDGQTVTMLLSATACVSMQGKTNGAIFIGQEITQLKTLDERKASMMAMVSHELKSPLHGIIGLCSSLMDSHADGEYNDKFPAVVETMRNCATRLLDMVANIMDASVLVNNKRMRMSKDPVQMKDVIEEVLHLCQSGGGRKDRAYLQKGVKLINTVNHPLPMIQADAYRCTQLLYNLVTNAMKFTHKGTITIAAGYSDAEQLLYIDVEDTGVGVSPENIHRIFEPFDQEDSQDHSESQRSGGLGLGLGLSISREVALKHGGDLTIESEVGVGSTFRLTLPYKMHVDSDTEDMSAEAGTPLQSVYSGRKSGSTASALRIKRRENTTSDSFAEIPSRAQTSLSMATASSTMLPSTTVPEVGTRRKILCVDDDPVHLEVIRALLPSSFKVDMVLDGLQALQYMDTHTKPDLILLDVMMPQMTGQQVLRALRRTYTAAQLPVIIVSAKSGQDKVASFQAMGANDYVMKPFGRAELLEHIRFHLNPSTARPSLPEESQPEANPIPEQFEHDVLVPEPLVEVLTKEMTRIQEDRDAAITEVEELRRKVSALELELEAASQTTKLSEEQLLFLQRCQSRQKANLEHHQWLASKLSQMELQQQIHQKLLSVTSLEPNAQTGLTFQGNSVPPMAHSYFWQVEKAQGALAHNLHCMEQLALKLPEAEKAQITALAMQLRRESTNLLLEMGETCHLLASAESEAQDQARLQWGIQQRVSLANDLYTTSLKLWPSSHAA